MIVGENVEIIVGPYSDLTKTSVVVLEQIGNGFLARSEDGQFCSVHYNFRGRLHTAKLTDEDEARKVAEESKGRMS